MAKRSGKKKSAHERRLSDYLKHKGRDEPFPVYVLRGTDPFLLEKGRAAVRDRTIGDADPGLAVAEFDGPEAQAAEVLDALRTLPFLAERRLVILREADDFLNKTTRPLLHTPDPKGTLTEIYDARVAVYAKADLVVDAHPEYSLSDMTKQVIRVLRTRPDVLEEMR